MNIVNYYYLRPRSGIFVSVKVSYTHVLWMNKLMFLSVITETL